MVTRIGQYRITEKLYESKYTLVYRGYRIRDCLPVILKVLRPESATHERLTAFKHEYNVVSRLNLPGVIKSLALEDYDNSLMMVLKDIGGDSLDHILGQTSLSLTQLLELMIALADAVGLIHKEHIIHKDINPSNIVYNQETKQVNLIDFGIADETPERSVTPQPPSALKGTLEYISPEQTGRMNRSVDYRTDFYSLGVTFYQMLTGKLPYKADDALGMIYSHIAKTPASPFEIDSNIPDMISRIVMKLLSKMADDRYQSAWGLKADLERCFENISSKGSINRFMIAQEDLSDKLHIPQKLYGRKREINQLLETFDRAVEGGRELLLVAGYAGVGKTALVHEVYRPILEKDGYFIEGKFEQLQRNVPYFAWMQAFAGFVNYLLMESEVRLAGWKENIQKAVGSIGRALTDVIPNLELIIGSQPEIPALSPTESQNRFNYVFVEFIKAIATVEHPLIIFLDDLQWIDAASLVLLETLMSSASVSNILVIGAYRDNEVDALHPLTIGIEALRSEKVSIDLMTLRDLSEETVNELIADTIRRNHSETVNLTHLVYTKTRGNPFFLLQTLNVLVEKQAIYFDSTNRCWLWDIAKLRAMEISDNVVDLMIGKIQQLSPEAQHTLPLAACIGFRFDLNILSIVAGQPENVVFKSLDPTLREGLITSKDGGFQFTHDRIQQAAYALIPDAEKKLVHLEIGRILFEHMTEQDLEEQLFKVVDHLNIGAELLKTIDESLELARLNLRAGVKAKASTAFSAAAKYFEAGVGMLDGDSWITHYDLTLELHTRAEEAASLVGDFKRTDQLFDIVTGKAKTAVDMAGAYESKINSFILRGKLQEAIDIALRILEKLGMSLSSYPTDDEITQVMEEVKSLYENIPIEDLINLPEMTDKSNLAIVRIMSKVNAVAYIGRPSLHLLIVLNEVIMSIKYGNAIESPYFYTTYALMLCGFQRDFKTGYRFGKLALSLLEATNNLAVKSKTLEVISGHVWHFKQHLKSTLPYLEVGYQSGLETGDLEYAGYSSYFYCCNSYFAGVNLKQLDQVMDSYYEVVKRIHAETARNVLAPYFQAVKNLISLPGDPCLLKGENFNQEEMLPILEQTHNTAALAALYVNRVVLCYLFGNYEQALVNSELAVKNKGGMLAMFTDSVSIFYDSLTRIQVYPNKNPLERSQILERVSANQQEMKRLAESAPMNFLHKFYLVEAERMRLAGEGMSTLDYYDNAISIAKENGYIQEEALGNELAAKFCLEKKKEDFARLYMTKARRCYESWGAVRKVKDLEERYSYLLEALPQGERAGVAFELLDLSTLMKAARAISKEIEMDKLLSEMMHIVIENVGAQIAFLLLEQEGEWQIVAKEGIGIEQTRISLPVDMDKSDLVARSVVRFVARTKQSIVLDNAERQGEFVNDPHIRHERTKSILCAPLLSRGRLIGIVYLENNLTTHAFIPARVQLLIMLLSQATVSLENARIYGVLRENELRYRQIVDTSNEGIWVLGPDALTTSVNVRMAEMLGYQVEEILGRPGTDFMFEEDASDHLQKIENRRKGMSEHYERRFRRKDGKTVWTLASASPIIDSDKRFNGSFAMLTDITERKKAEEELKRHRDHLEELVEERTSQLGVANERLLQKINQVVQLQQTVESQLSLLQQALVPPTPDIIPGYHAASTYLPAYQEQNIGGDLYDVFMTEEGKIGAMIGDVSGKGIEAAALAASARSTVHSFAYELGSPEVAMYHANAVLQSQISGTRDFVTVFLAIIDPSTGTLNYSRAGHPPAAVFRREGKVEFLREGEFPIGLLAGLKYGRFENHLNPGDKIILFTDGITEARRNGKLFDLEGIEQALLRFGGASPNDIVQGLVEEARKWSEDNLQDDIAILVIERAENN